MELLNNGKLADVFIEDGYIEVKSIDTNENDYIQSSEQLKEQLCKTLYIDIDKINIEDCGGRNSYHFWRLWIQTELKQIKPLIIL